MMTLTARGYMVSRLDKQQLERLHDTENAQGYCLTPNLISEKFNLPKIGEVQPNTYANIERKSRMIESRIRWQYRAKHNSCCFKKDFKEGEKWPGYRVDCKDIQGMDLTIKHSWDFEMHGNENFKTTPKAGKAKQSMLDDYSDN